MWMSLWASTFCFFFFIFLFFFLGFFFFFFFFASPFNVVSFLFGRRDFREIFNLGNKPGYQSHLKSQNLSLCIVHENSQRECIAVNDLTNARTG